MYIQSLAESWLKEQVSHYSFDLEGVFRNGDDVDWPLTATNPQDLAEQLMANGQILPLPKESAALANILEVSIVDFLIRQVSDSSDVQVTRGTERGYPDIELSGDGLGGGYHAVDVKVARRGRTSKGLPTTSTQSRITLYTGNTYFRYPQLKWPGTFRPFDEYESHLDILGIYTLNETSPSRVEDLELIVQPPWRIASKQRSSTTREYIGAVQRIDALREGRGEFDSPEAFYEFWRKFNFRIGRVVQQQLDKLLKDPSATP